LLIEEGASSAYTDLTQELFVQLLTKSRFQHYLDTAMTDAEIECEIGQIELTNLLTAELRKRHPESYRLARRISTLIQSSANFRRFDSSGTAEEQHRRLADRVYGLSEWSDNKPGRGSHEMEQRAHMIAVRQRDTRMVGCTGDAQIVISNSDLEDLIVSVLDAIDAPADVRTLRSLVMSRLPVMDIYLVPLGGDDPDSDGPRYDPADLRENPEQSLLRHESERQLGGLVQPLLVVDQADQRLVPGHLGEQAEHGQPDQEPVRRRARGQAERGSQCVALRHRNPVEVVQHRGAQLMQSGEGQLHLRVHTGRPRYPASARPFGQIIEQHRLAHARIAAYHQHPALPRPDRVDQPVEHVAFAVPVGQPRRSHRAAS
jgi:hypothetical protein